MKQLHIRMMSLYSSEWFIWGLVAFGTLVRLTQLLANRSLWVDEAALASSIVSRSYLRSFQLLDYWQIAPIRFPC